MSKITNDAALAQDASYLYPYGNSGRQWLGQVRAYWIRTSPPHSASYQTRSQAVARIADRAAIVAK